MDALAAVLAAALGAAGFCACAVSVITGSDKPSRTARTRRIPKPRDIDRSFLHEPEQRLSGESRPDRSPYTLRFPRMNIVVGIVSPNQAWVLPRPFVDELRRDFPQHTFIDVWDRESLRRALPDGDAAFAAFVDRDIVHALARLKWVQ